MSLLNVGVDCVFELLELQGETRVVGRGIGAELGDAGTVSRRGTIKWTMDGWRERSVKGFEVITYSSIEDGSYVVGCEGAASPRP